MKLILIVLLLILSGCTQDEYLITNDVDLMRQFQRDCLNQRATYIALEPRLHDGYWKVTCVKVDKNPLSDAPIPEGE